MRDARTQSHSLAPAFDPLCVLRFAGAALFTLAVPAAAQVHQSRASWTDALTAYVTPSIQMNDFSGTILILREGRDSVVAGFGLADRARGIANGPATRFGIGSLTKTFTAAAIAILHERGALSLDDTLGKYIPRFPHGGEITIRHLLAHRSGVPDYHSLPDYHARRARPTTLAEFAAWIGTKQLDFRPGARDAYSSSGYALLAYVIERVSGLKYGEFLRRNLFEPLGMTETGELSDGRSVPGLATGYDPGFPPAGVQSPPRMSATWLEGSGSLYSTTADLLRWARAIRDDRLFQLEALDYPYGWGKRTWLGREVFEQDGRIALGYASHISIYPKDSVIVVILGNIQSAVSDRMRTDLAALAFGEPYQVPELRSSANPRPALLQQYTGRYEVGPGFVMTVQAEGHHLSLAGPEGDFLPLEPESDSTFFFRALYVPVRFERDTAGAVVDLNWGGQFVCKKIQ
jgi:CubicO group peptidase (beta-lactamase class C family)